MGDVVWQLIVLHKEARLTLDEMCRLYGKFAFY